MHLEKRYAYKAQNGTCKNPKGKSYKVRRVKRVLKRNTKRYLMRLEETPLTTSYFVSDDFFDYASGVYEGDGCEGVTRTNHAVLAVGYDVGASTPFVRFKNSWGTGWGDSGFFKMAIDKKKKTDGTCNMLLRRRSVYVKV